MTAPQRTQRREALPAVSDPARSELALRRVDHKLSLFASGAFLARLYGLCRHASATACRLLGELGQKVETGVPKT